MAWVRAMLRVNERVRNVGQTKDGDGGGDTVVQVRGVWREAFSLCRKSRGKTAGMAPSCRCLHSCCCRGGAGAAVLLAALHTLDMMTPIRSLVFSF